jgi:hypothetical protein
MMPIGSIVIEFVPEFIVLVLTIGPTGTVVTIVVSVSEFRTGSNDIILSSELVLSATLSGASFGAEMVVIADDSSTTLDPTVTASG